MNLIEIDVKDLQPPEPMTAILSALSQLTSGEVGVPNCLVVKHRRQPFPLYEKLLASGWSYHCDVKNDDDIVLYIFRKTAQQAFDIFFKSLKLKIKKSRGQ
jgi:hypothetical protein